jgi:hypothetical protein
VSFGSAVGSEKDGEVAQEDGEVAQEDGEISKVQA